MESPSLNSPPPPPDDDAALAALLRRSAPSLPDDGFSASVLAALPPQRHSWVSQRSVFTLAAGFAGAAFAWHQIAAVGGENVIAQQLAAAMDGLQLTAHHAVRATEVTAFSTAMSLALGITGLSLAYAFRGQLLNRVPPWLRT